MNKNLLHARFTFWLPLSGKVAVMIAFCFLFDFASSQTKVDTLQQRVKVLEDNRSNMEQLYKISEEKLSGHIDDLIRDKMKDVDEQKRILSMLVFVGVPGTIIGFLLVYLGAIKKAKKFIIDKIEKIVEHKREELIKLIETQEFDSKLRKIKRIMILSTSEEAQGKIKQIFDKFKFQKVNYRIVTEYKDYPDNDLIVFNDYDESFEPDVITEFITKAKNEEIGFVAYTSRKLQGNPRLNFSNAPFTLYHNVLSTLKYSEILKVTESN